MPGPSIQARLSQFWIFHGFSQDDLARVGHLFREQSLTMDSVLFHQGDLPTMLYLLVDGRVREQVAGPGGQPVVRRTAVGGDIIGHRSLLDKQPHRASATVVEPSRLLVLDGGDLVALLGVLPNLEVRLRRIDVVNRMLGIPLFGSLSDEELRDTADLARVLEYPAGQRIYGVGEPADALYVIDSGQVLERAQADAPSPKMESRYCTAGSFFGQDELRKGTNRLGSAEVLSDAILFRLEVEAVNWLRQSHSEFEAVLQRNDLLTTLRQTRVFGGFSEDDLLYLAGYVGMAHYRPRDTIHFQGELDPTLYILYEGLAATYTRDQDGQESPRGYLSPGESVGETCLFLQDPCDSTLVSSTHTNWLYLARSDLNELLKVHPSLAEKLMPDRQVKARQNLKRFEWMEPGEQLVMDRRRHWFLPLMRLALPSLLLLSGLAVSASPVVPGFIAYGLLLASLLWMLWRIIDWLNDHYLVTTSRVAHREKVLLIRETLDETPLESIQNVNIDQGFLGNLLGFGTLLIDTAARSSAARVVFTYVAEPEQVKGEVFERANQVRASKRWESQRAIQERLEKRMTPGIRPTVPRPVIRITAPSAPMSEQRPGIWRRIAEATLHNWFWIERRGEGEVTWRKHWIRLLARVWAPAISTMCLSLLAILAAAASGGLFVFPLLVLAVPLAFSLGWLWWNWQNWGNDLYTVTNDRLIDVEALPLGFRMKRTETTFDRIQNVSFEIPHPIAMLLNYGTVAIYTAGAEGRLDFFFVRSPKGVQAEIFHRLARYREAERRRQTDQQTADLPNWFAAYDATLRPGT